MATAKETLEQAMRGEGCLGKAIAKDPNMPVFVLVATDATADEHVTRWAIRAQSLGCNIDKVNEAHALAAEMEEYPTRKNPD